TDSLIDIRSAINNLKVGVRANILKVGENDYRLIIASEAQGAEGFTLANTGATNLLEQLGFTDGTDSIRRMVSGSVVSSTFAASNVTVGSLIGLSGTSAGTILIKGQEVSINLATDSLASIRDKINNLGISGVTASVESVTDGDQILYRLTVSGTTDFADDGNVLETLGILAGGTSGISASFQFGPLTTGNTGQYAQESTLLSHLGAQPGGAGETITISGTDDEGYMVLSTYAITQQSTIGDVLQAVEEAFAGSVTAEMSDGKIVITTVSAGETALTVNLTANNENGGTLDFGVVTQTETGRSRLIAAGTDAVILVNGIRVTRSTNEINDVLSGLTLNLKNADPETAITITVEQNTSAIKEKIKGVVDSYNKFIEYVNEKTAYDQEKEVAGPLLGDLTTRTIVNRVQNVLQTVMDGQDFEFTMLAQIGIELTTTGTLDINTSKLDEVLRENPDDVISLFTVTRTSTDNDISFVYNSPKTAPGTYDVTITRAPEQASATSDVLGEDIGVSGVLAVTDEMGAGFELSYTGDMTFQDLADQINTEARTTYAKVLTSSSALIDMDGAVPATQSTKIGDIAGVTVNENDTITIAGKTLTGKSFQRTLRLTDGDSYSLQDILNYVVTLNDNKVTAAIDNQGSIVVQDNDTGSSKLELAITTTISGLDFGEFAVTQEGRNRVTVGASVTTDNWLQLTHTSYGSAKTFTTSGGELLGISDSVYQGIDIAGTINGVAGAGEGSTLTASYTDTASRGIIINSTITPEDLASEGSAQGTITLVAGIGERLYNELTSITKSVDGFIQTQIDSLQLETEYLKSRIDDMNQRLEQRREAYVRRFTALEKAMSQLQTLQQQLTSTLSVLPTQYS
ncbi:flagellar filament capping protein FliD, partial [Candidatus Latescibacterota bacterium]